MTWPTHTADGREIEFIPEWFHTETIHQVPTLLRLIDKVPDRVYLIVTRHAERVAEMWLNGSGVQNPAFSYRPNVWLQIECHTQAECNAITPALLASLRQLCGVVGVHVVPEEMITIPAWLLPVDPHNFDPEFRVGIGWLTLAGGDKPVHPDHFRGPIRQAEAAGVPVNLLSWGSWLPIRQWDEDSFDGEVVHVRHDGAVFDDDEPMGFCCCNCRSEDVLHIGPARSGRTLDGRTWDGVPA